MIRKQSADSQHERKGILKNEFKYGKQKSVDSRNNQSIYQDSHDLNSYSINQKSQNNPIFSSSTSQANAVLMDLRPEDKGRVGQLIKRLAEEKQIKENLQMKIQENSKDFNDRLSHSQKEKQSIINDTLLLKEQLKQSMNLLQQYQSYSSTLETGTIKSGLNLSGKGSNKLCQSLLPFKEINENTLTNLNRTSAIHSKLKGYLSNNINHNSILQANQHSQVIHSYNQRNSLSPFQKAVKREEQTDLCYLGISVKKPERITIHKKKGESEQLYNTWKKQNNNQIYDDQQLCNSYFKEEDYQNFKSLREVKQLHSKMEELTTSFSKINQKYSTNQSNIPTQIIQKNTSQSKENTPQRMLQGDVRSISTQQAQTSQNDHFISKESFLGGNVESNEETQQQLEIEETKIDQRIQELKRQKLLYHLQGNQRRNNEKENDSKLVNSKRNENGKQLENQYSKNKIDYPAPQVYPTFSRDSLEPAQIEDSCLGKLSLSGLQARKNMNNDVIFEDLEIFSNQDLSRQATQKIISKMDKKELRRLRKQLKNRINELDQIKQNPKDIMKQQLLKTNSNIFEISNTQQINSLKDSELMKYSQNTQSLSAPFSKSKDSFNQVVETRQEEYNNQLDFSYPQLKENAQGIIASNQTEQQYHQQFDKDDQNEQEYYQIEDEDHSIKSKILAKLEELTEEDLEQVMAVIKAKKNNKTVQYQKVKNTHETDFDEREEQKIAKVEYQSYHNDQAEGKIEFKKPSNINHYDNIQPSNEDRQYFSIEKSKQLNKFEIPRGMFSRQEHQKNHKNQKIKSNTLDTHSSSSNSNKSFEYKNRLKYEESEESHEETDRSMKQIKPKIYHKK